MYYHNLFLSFSLSQHLLSHSLQHGAVCHSSPSTTLSSTNSEDCLFLDVYAPTDSSKLHPVFVFIQGGGFNGLGSPNLNATSLIAAGDHDMVVVTFNYRVGPWGFLASKEVVENGDTNIGLKDQRFLLEWVQKNIKQVSSPDYKGTVLKLWCMLLTHRSLEEIPRT